MEYAKKIIECSILYKSIHEKLVAAYLKEDWMGFDKIVELNFDYLVQTIPYALESERLYNKSSAEIKNGKLNGKFLMYWPNGNLRIECNYVDGQKEGKYVEYFPDGTKWHEYLYIRHEVKSS